MTRKVPEKLILLPIEKGIPIPEVESVPRWKKKAKYSIPLRMLEIGDSIFIPDAKYAPLREMHFLKKKFGRNYVYRTQRTEEGVAYGIRVWRIEPNPNNPIDPEARKRDEMEKIKQNKENKKEVTLRARGLEKESSWMKPKKRNCLWCGVPFESNNAGDRYHPNCRASARNAG